MAPVPNARVLYSAVPKGFPVPGKDVNYDDSQKIDLDTIRLHGGILVGVLVLSIDPYQRECMRDPASDVVSFVSPYQLDEPIENFAVGIVKRSEAASYAKGDYVYGMLPFTEYTVFTAETLKYEEDTRRFRKLIREPGVPLSAYVGVCGMPGQAAYFGWREFADPQKGDIVFVTTAGGPVGSFVIQLAKAAGLKVIASAGSDTKAEFARSVGADVAFNYKTTSTEDVLKKEGPINIYWDNVGGEVLGIALANAAFRARFIECGQIAGYNTGYPPVHNVEQIFVRALKVYGLLGYNHASQYLEEFYKEIPPKVARGEIKYKEDIKRGLAKAPEAIFEVQTGKNEGKSVIIVADE